MRVPSSMPEGMFTESVRSSVTRPCPEHFAQGSLIVWPRPWQVGQVRSIEKKPWLALTRPEPEHMAHVTGWVPGFAPEPEHSVHAMEDGTRICAVLPVKASSSVISML
jgi:hypothetical protein